MISRFEYFFSNNNLLNHCFIDLDVLFCKVTVQSVTYHLMKINNYIF